MFNLKKSIILLALFICLFICISGDFACEMDNSTIADVDANMPLGVVYPIDWDTENDQEHPIGTFNELNEDLKDLNESDYYILKRDYVFDEKNDSSHPIINITGDYVKIYGNGHKIDACGSALAKFVVTGAHVSVYDLSFINFKTNDTSSIQWNGYKGILTECRFYNNTALNGGAITWNGNYGRINYCLFGNNAALNCGAVIYVTGENNMIFASTFRTFVSNLSNEAIYFSNKNGQEKTLSIDSCLFENNGTFDGITKILWDEGCTVFYEGRNMIYDIFDVLCNDIENLSPGDYYILERNYVVTNPEGNLVRNRIINIKADNVVIDGNGHKIDGGGAKKFFSIFNVTGNNVSIVNLIIFNSRAYDADYILSNKNIYGDEYNHLTSPIEWHGDNGIISNCLFYDNVGDNGGAIHWTGRNGSIENCTFDANSATFGGSLYINGNATLIRNCIFKNSFTQYYHEAIYFKNNSNPTLTLNNCSFASNEVGAKDVYAEKGCIVIFNEKHENDFPQVPFRELSRQLSLLNDNDVYDFDENYYPDIFDQAIINSNNVTINGNGYKIYGDFAAYNIFTILSDNVKIINLIFVFNEANRKGLSIINWSGNNGILENCSFVGNRAETGGAVIWSGNNGILRNCGFMGNEANAGGALYWSGNNGLIDNCVFLNNTATMAGALFISGTGNTIKNSLFENAGGSVSNEAIYIDRNRKSPKLSNLVFSEGTIPFIDGYFFDIDFTEFFKFGYEDVDDKKINENLLSYATLLKGNEEVYNGFSCFSVYNSESGILVLSVLESFNTVAKAVIYPQFRWEIQSPQWNSILTTLGISDLVHNSVIKLESYLTYGQ